MSLVFFSAIPSSLGKTVWNDAPKYHQVIISGYQMKLSRQMESTEIHSWILKYQSSHCYASDHSQSKYPTG